ncbi:MAG TPA: LPS-assembly protein LptD, partial [Myxococcaceae bacterium]|nr:LPS-assembly protein LptD [Myxococcaceae bacterium]
GGSDRVRAGLDMLFAERAAPGAPVDLLVAGGRAAFGFGLGLRYEAVLQPLRETGKLTQHTVGASWSPACDCWRLEAHATFRPGTAIPDLGVILTLARFGSFGSGG